MKLKELIAELKKHEKMFGDCEVVTYFDLSWKNPPRKRGSKIMIVNDEAFPLETVSWEDNI